MKNVTNEGLCQTNTEPSKRIPLQRCENKKKLLVRVKAFIYNHCI